MARRAQQEAEEKLAAEEKVPNFAKALRILSNDVRPAEENSAGSRGDLSAAWKSIEDDCNLNKKAAKDFYRLQRMSSEKKDDYLRTLYGLMQAGGIGISQDLVDRMSDSDAPEMPIAAGAPAEGLATLETTH